MNMKLSALILISSILSPYTFAAKAASSSTVVQVEDVKWGYLNPLRGDKSPGAAELWGDRSKDVSTGMLVRFKPGFSSPPHIHNVTYRGVVIDGRVHNDDPNAEKLWMPTGSFWTQPAGENHITAASGESNLIFLEIDSGPYLVKPSNTQFDNGERPVNLHASNLVWLGADNLEFVKSDGVEIAMLWGSTIDGEVGGSLIKLQSGFKGSISTDTNEFRAVVIQGKLGYIDLNQQKGKNLLPGSYIGSTGKYEHRFSANEETLIYIRTNGIYRVVSY